MTDLKNYRWSPICVNCRDCCYDYEFDDDPWNLGVERIDKKGNKVSGKEFIQYLKNLGGEAAKRIDKLRIDEFGCIEVIMPKNKTYRDKTNCIFLDENSNCVIHPSRINLDFDLRGKLCASYLCEIAEFVNKEMPYLNSYINKVKQAHEMKYGENQNLNLIQYLKTIPKSYLKNELNKILKIKNVL
ncbi:MAG: hypothetical protein ACTSPY_16890 [Candidatus Helarchaeota archaeon]